MICSTRCWNSRIMLSCSSVYSAAASRQAWTNGPNTGPTSRRILGSAGQVTAKLTETLDPVDVETTIRALQDVTKRVAELLAG